MSLISYLWNQWNIRSFVLLSLLLQVFLILFAPIRKKTADKRIFFLLWLTYLMADWVAAFALGLISHHQGKSPYCAAGEEGSIYAFWASFLLLHLGGPDTIAAFSLEDSSLWRRHLLGLIFQVGAAIYVFMQVFGSDRLLVVPTILVFIAGIIKNAERTLALYRSSIPRLRFSMLVSSSSHAADNKLVEELKVLGDEYSHGEETKLDESIVVEHGYYFFQIFKVFLGDLIFTSEQRQMSCQYFHKVSAMDAYRVISVELNFFYALLHTKTLAIRSKLSYIFRFIAFANVVVAFILFNHLKKHRLPKVDVKITYILLFGGIALDVIALFMLVFSDWTVAEIQSNYRRSRGQDSFLHKLVSAMDGLRKPRFSTCKAEPKANVAYTILDTRYIFRRWSESISACNLFSEYLKESPRKMSQCNRSRGTICLSNICCFPFIMIGKMMSCFQEAGATIAGGGGRGAFTYDSALTIVNMKYMSQNPFINKLWILIFKEVKRKCSESNSSEEVKKIFEARGDLFLENKPEEIDCSKLSVYVTKSNYDFSILTWHIATEIWYNIEQPAERNDEREFSKILSDYMVYLLLNQSIVVSAVAGSSQMTSGETLFEIWIQVQDSIKDVERLCKKLYDASVDTNSRSALGMGINLAREIDGLKQKKWKVMSGVWVEMLSYAAVHIKGEAHVQVLSKGGELLAFVWLLMAHFGCFYKTEWGISYERYHLYQRPK